MRKILYSPGLEPMTWFYMGTNWTTGATGIYMND